MDTTQLVAGTIYLFIGTFFPPLYGRMIYILIARSQYRKLEVYRIVALIGIVQLLCTPAAFLGGLTHLLDYDPGSIAEISMKLFSAACKAEVPLSFILALNRLKVICGLRYPNVIHNILIVIFLLYGLVFFILLLTPYASSSYTFTPHMHLPKYDLTFEVTFIMSKSSAIISLIFTIATLVCYIVVCFYLTRMQAISNVTKDWRKERSILVYAGIRFLFDLFVLVFFNFVTLPPLSWIPVVIMASYFLNMLFLPLFLYLLLNT
ncbi:hypothetical protein L596_019386 [Steinernema carpocapsae]|uniref:7TM GPCR serpentine receptor class x (Srx) domain-containing protein n=1 Tax=Steinernema carpocapsae TaxID=34508 RepID=A0A4U5MR94_STECR|nr:hypothetical protein L596_019386 [Steinernema carpocapsae]